MMTSSMLESLFRLILIIFNTPCDYLYNSPCKYFNPESQITVTIFFPGPNIFAR